MHLEIESMGPQHVGAAVEIEQGLPGPWDKQQFQSVLGKTNSWARVALNGRVCGFNIATCAGEELQIDRIAVLAEARGRGIGKLLMADALDYGRRMGCREVILEVRPSNASALALYAGFGFQVLSRRRAYYATGEDALVMRKDLQTC